VIPAELVVMLTEFLSCAPLAHANPPLEDRTICQATVGPHTSKAVFERELERSGEPKLAGKIVSTYLRTAAAGCTRIRRGPHTKS